MNKIEDVAPDGLVSKVLVWHVKVDVLWPARRVRPRPPKGRVQVHLRMNEISASMIYLMT